MEFKFEGKLKTTSIVLMVIGAIALVGGFVTDTSDHHQRWWSNLLINGYFFFAIALGALFFYALQYAAEVGWSAYIKRFFEAMFAYLPIGSIVIVIVLLAGQAHLHHIYHWMDHTLYHEFMIVNGDEVTYTDTQEAGAVVNPNYDYIIANKSAYLNTAFFWLRTVIYLATFLIFARLFRKWSLQEDQEGGTRLHFLQYRRSALFLVFFAVFSSTLSWDWLMSIDTHWFSTLYGWYVFSGMWVSTMIFALVSLLWMRSKGFFPNLSDSHVHDMSKWMFAISMLWSYLWFSQFMLIWYSNIPEEVTYYVNRMFTDYSVPFMVMFFINFAVPFYVLIARDAKRNPSFILPVAFLIFIGHFADVYMLIIPGTMHDHNHFGWMEVGMFLGFLGLFMFSTFRALSKAPLVAKNHPYLQESKELHI
jgi:hypothetical protein